MVVFQSAPVSKRTNRSSCSPRHSAVLIFVCLSLSAQVVSPAPSPSTSSENAPRPDASGNATSTDATAGHNITAPLPTTSAQPPPLSSGGGGGAAPPTSSRLGVGFGAAFGFAVVVVLLVLWHILQVGRQRQRFRARAAAYEFGSEGDEQEGGGGGGGGVATDEVRPGWTGLHPLQQKPADASASSSTSSSTSLLPAGYPERKGQQNDATVTEIGALPLHGDQSTELASGDLSEGGESPPPRGWRRRQESRWFRRDGHGPWTQGAWGTRDAADDDASRPRFSFEGVAQSEESIESLSQARLLAREDGKGNRGT